MEATDDAFWDQFWADTATTVQDVFALLPAAEIRAVREESPSNLATLCYKVAFSTALCAEIWHLLHMCSINIDSVIRESASLIRGSDCVSLSCWWDRKTAGAFPFLSQSLGFLFEAAHQKENMIRNLRSLQVRILPEEFTKERKREVLLYCVLKE